MLAAAAAAAAVDFFRFEPATCGVDMARVGADEAVRRDEEEAADAGARAGAGEATAEVEAEEGAGGLGRAYLRGRKWRPKVSSTGFVRYRRELIRMYARFDPFSGGRVVLLLVHGQQLSDVRDEGIGCEEKSWKRQSGRRQEGMHARGR